MVAADPLAWWTLYRAARSSLASEGRPVEARTLARQLSKITKRR